MNVLSKFSIPYKGMGFGIHNLEYDIDSSFFSHFEASHIENGSFKILVELDKRHDHSILSVDIDGYTKTNCDRCLEDIDLPMYGDYKLHIKHSEEGESTDEIMYIHPETSIFNLAQIIYEFVLLSMPIIKAYDCENDEKPPCNYKVLDRLDAQPSEDIEKDSSTGIWDSLKGLELDE